MVWEGGRTSPRRGILYSVSWLSTQGLSEAAQKQRSQHLKGSKIYYLCCSTNFYLIMKAISLHLL